MKPAAELIARFLTHTAASAPPTHKKMSADQIQWLIDAGLGPLAADTHAQSSALLQADAYAAMGEAAMRWDAFQHLVDDLQQLDLPIVPLKGMALALTVYPEMSRRTMSDIDIWLDEEGMQQAAVHLPRQGWRFDEKEDRPYELQKLAAGEMRFIHPRWPRVLVELHWSPFAGWWLKRTADIDESAVWQRLCRHQIDGLVSPIHTLSPEDAILHLIIHLAVNHQFGLSAIRTLVDMALLAEKETVDWHVVLERSRQWRVSTAVWITLHTAVQLIPFRGLSPDTLELCAPSKQKQKLLQRYVSPQSMLHGQDIRSSADRFALLLLLVDRPRDLARLVGRTLWPEPQWLHARYGRPTSHLAHLWHLIRHREI